MADDIIKLLQGLNDKFDEHSKASQLREQRTIGRIDAFEKDVRRKLDDVTHIAQRALNTATDAHETARHAKHAAGQASITSEGNDQALYAELGSMKVVMNDVVTKVAKVNETIADHADKLAAHDEARRTERKKDRKSERIWRTLQPAVIAVALAGLNRLTFVLAPPTPKVVGNETAQIEPPVKVIEPMTVEVAAKRPTPIPTAVDAGH